MLSADAPSFKPIPMAKKTRKKDKEIAIYAPFASDEVALRVMPDLKLRTHLCVSWKNLGWCPYENKCTFAHGIAEINTPRGMTIQGTFELFASINCRIFHKNMYCKLGKKCFFRHEHRGFTKVHRHYYMPRLNVIELLFAVSKNPERHLYYSFDTQVKPLSVFTKLR